MGLLAQVGLCDAPVAKKFLQFLHGADGVNVTNLCLPTADLWMLAGAKNTNLLEALDAEKFDAKKQNGIVSGILGGEALYFFELKDGKVDPAFPLDGIRSVHRQVIMAFLYHSLRHDKSMLDRVATDASKVDIVGKKAAGGDMDQYASILELIPVIRSSKPEDDTKTKSVTYRVPLGETGLSLTLIKKDDMWKINTANGVKVPLEFFFREEEGGRRVR